MRRGIAGRIASAVGGIGFLLALGGAAVAQENAPAPDAERMALAAEFAAIVGPAEIEGMMRPMVDGMWPFLDQALPERTDDATRAEIRAYFLDAMTPLIAEPVAAMMDVMLPEMTAVTAEVYTVAEMRAWLAFYDTAAGRKLLRAQVDGMVGPIVAVSLDFGGAMEAGIAALNVVLQKNGIAGATVPDGLPTMPPPEPVTPTDAIVAARALVLLAPEAFDAMAAQIAGEFETSMWSLVALPFSAPGALRDELRIAFTAGVVAYYRTLLPLAADQMAAAIAAALTPAELAEAIAFYGMPEARNWQRQGEAFGAAMQARFETIMPALAPTEAEFERRLGEVAAGVDAILVRHGLPPIGP